MEVLRDGDKLVFLYQLAEGSTNTSYACHIAALANLPQKVIARGIQVSMTTTLCRNSVVLWHIWMHFAFSIPTARLQDVKMGVWKMH